MVETTRAQHKIVVPTSLSMVSLLGSVTSSCASSRQRFGSRHSRPRQRDNVTGEQGDVALVERLFDELITILRTGQGITA